MQQGEQKSGEPVVEFFALRKANGYKDIEFYANSAVKIIVAENGAGKTTLLNALYYILTGNFKGLISIEFDSFEIVIKGKRWIQKRSDFAPLSEETYLEFIAGSTWERSEFSVPSKLEAEELIVALSTGEEGAIESTKYYHRESNNHRFPPSYLKSNLQTLPQRTALASIKKKQENFTKFAIEIIQTLDGVSVLYLPTYRRIEASLPEYRSKYVGRNFGARAGRRSNQLIHFGLHDVEQRLADMAEEIRLSTVRAFSQINGRALDDLLFGNYTKTVTTSKSIDVNSLRVVLGRLGRDDEKTRQRIESLIDSGEINEENNIYLKSFLGQLVQTYASTQAKEAAIERFVAVVNSYWADEINEKSFVFDKASAEATVVNTFTGNPLALEALSSGEKQIISVFARLYLETREDVIVLIDEPELSLSMEWQVKFLPDVAKAANCKQLLAITHSPFIFRNELRPYAGDMTVIRHKLSRE